MTDPLLSATFDMFMRALVSEPAIIHFAGHGYPEGIIIEDDKGQGEVIENDILKMIFADCNVLR